MPVKNSRLLFENYRCTSTVTLLSRYYIKRRPQDAQLVAKFTSFLTLSQVLLPLDSGVRASILNEHEYILCHLVSEINV